MAPNTPFFSKEAESHVWAVQGVDVEGLPVVVTSPSDADATVSGPR